MCGPSGLQYHEKAIGASAQTERSDDAGPVRDLLGGITSPAAFVSSNQGPESVKRATA